MITLLFPIDKVLRLAEHAAAAPQHQLSLGQIEDGEPAVPSLVWVKDQGIYLVSNGLPVVALDPANPGGGLDRVYADGWGAGSRHKLDDIAEIGGDDFAEFIDLAEHTSAGVSLLQHIRQCVRQGCRWFALDVDDLNTFGIHFPGEQR